MYHNFDDDDFMEMLRKSISMQAQKSIKAIEQNRKIVERFAMTKAAILEEAVSKAVFSGRVVVVYFYGEKYKVFPDLSKIELWREI